MAILKASCYHKEERHGDCEYGGNTYMLLFGVVQILMSHILDFHSMVLVSVVAAIMSFCYSSIGRKISATRLIHRTPSFLGGVLCAKVSRPPTHPGRNREPRTAKWYR
ncbi:putative amino acid transporter, transmembrane domain-containing protein [Helianthus annuus]|nr:putative amino acid transporter, transmembrane domain-containing protein [Helianthus annuus]